MSKHKKSRTGPDDDPAPSVEAAQVDRSGRKRLLLVLGLLGAGIVVLCIARPFSGREGEKRQPDPPREILTEEGLQQEILDVCHQLLAEFPDDLDPPGLMGLACFKLGRYAETAEWYQRALELNPRLPQAHFMMAEAAINQGEFELAVERCRKALAIHPGMPGVNGRLGRMLFELGRPEESVAPLKAELLMQPDSGKFNDLLGQAYMQLNQYEQAVPYFEKALEITPDASWPYYGLAKAYRKLGQDDKASEFRRQFKKRRAVENEAVLEQGGQGMDMGYLTEVAATIHTGAGQVYAGKGSSDSAEMHWRRAVVLDRGNLRCRQLLAESCMHRQKWSEALELYQELLRFDPAEAVYHLNKGVALVNLGNLDEAEKAIRQSLRLNPRNPAGLHSLVQVLSVGKGRLPEARAAAQKLVELAPTAENYGLLAGLCGRIGDQAGARVAMERAQQLAPGSR